MLQLLNTAKRYGMILLVGSAVTASSIALIQTFRVKTYKSEIKDLTATVASLEKAAVLVEALHQKNTKLLLERDELLKEIPNAEGYDDPLPDSIDWLLERLHKP